MCSKRVEVCLTLNAIVWIGRLEICAGDSSANLESGKQNYHVMRPSEPCPSKVGSGGAKIQPGLDTLQLLARPSVLKARYLYLCRATFQESHLLSGS